MTPDQIGIIVGAIFTLFILSYLLGDNFLFRFATHVLVGAGAAYIAFTVFVDVLWERVVKPLIALQTLQTIDPSVRPPVILNAVVAGIGILFGLLLLFKIWPRWAGIGNIPVGYLVGVGAAVALGGALFGTIGAQVYATALPPKDIAISPTSNLGLNVILNIIVVVGTLTALLSFGFYRAARRGILSGVNSIGRWFVSIALGATFALVYVASVTVLIDRVQAIVDAFGLITGSK